MNKTTQTYPWQRYLCPANESYARTADGFLIPPDESTLRRPNQHLRTVASLAHEPCLVILGEPGIGKSRVLQEFADTHRSQLGPNDIVIEEKFAGFATVGDLRSELFQSPDFESWRRGVGTLYLFLDALDEAHVPIAPLMQTLLRNLRDKPCERLFLRLSCRTTTWPHDYEQELCSFWNLATLPIYKTTVLSRQDVRLAAEANKITSDDFFNQLVISEVTPLAVIPITLELLLQLYDKSGALPKSRRELYAKGCRHLCEETNLQHQRIQSRAMLLEQRLLVVARIAALSFLAGREVIDSSINDDLAKETHLHLQDLVGYSETFRGQKIEVADHLIKEALDTGLFAPLAPDQYGWVHRTFQEYLTAYYLVHHTRERITVEQILQLLETPQDSEAQFPPQLHDMIGWLATLSNEVQQAILQREPALLLTSDATVLTNEDRAQLVQWLLIAVDHQQYFAGFDTYRLYQKLGHPGLSDQLQPILTDGNRAVETRRLAVDLAERNEVYQLQHTLVQLALDCNCPLALRVDAAQAVAEIGDDSAKQHLKPLLQDPHDDEYQRLKSAALHALWPTHLTATELFAVLTPRGQDTMIDLHRSFLANEIVGDLQIADLPVALAWVAQNTSFQPADHEIERLKDEIVSHALLHLDVAEVRAALVATLLIKLEHHDNIIGGGSTTWEQHEVLSDETKRRYLFRLLLEECVNCERDVSLPLWSRPSLVASSDLPWLVKELYPQLSISLQKALAVVIGRLWYYEDPEQSALIYEAVQQHSILAEHFSHVFESTPINSEQAEQMRQRYQRLKEIAIRQVEPTITQYVPQVDLRLAEAEANGKRWWALNLELMATTTGALHEEQPDMQKMPGWLGANMEMRQRIVRTAITYLVEGEPNDEYWFGKSDIRYRPAQAGYRALYLLCQNSPDSLDKLSTPIISKWALSMIMASTWAFPIEPELDKRLLLFFAKRATNSYIAAGVQALQTISDLMDLRGIADRLSVEWSTEFSVVLWRQIEQHSDEIEYFKSLLPYLIQYDEETARLYIRTHLLDDDQEAHQLSEFTMVAALNLLYHESDAGWTILWPFIQTHTDFGKNLYLRASSRLAFDNQPLTSKLGVPEIAALYCWLVIHFPHDSDPPIPKDAYTPTPHHNVCRLRDSFLNALVNAGTREAVEAIAEIISQNPTIPDRERYLFVAQEQWRRHSWQPIQPAQLLALIHAAKPPTFDQRYQHVGVQYNNVYLVAEASNLLT
ncbi:MAG: hypothetical protein R3E79_24175 [Caldilineaceae bacterium]